MSQLRVGEKSVDGFDAADLGHVLFEVAFDAHLEGDGGRWATDAGTVEADADDLIGGDLDKLDVAAIGLDGGADEVDDLGDALEERGVGGGGCGATGRGLWGNLWEHSGDHMRAGATGRAEPGRGAGEGGRYKVVMMNKLIGCLAGWLVVAAVASGADPLADMGDSKAGDNKRLNAVDQAWAEVEAGTGDRAATREALKKLVWTIGKPSDRVRVRAIEKLLADETAEGAADNVNLFRLRLPTETGWPVIELLANQAAIHKEDDAWKVLTAPFVRSYARSVPTPPDEDRPEKDALLALHPGKDVVEIAFGVFVDPEANGAGDGEFAEKARQGAWDLMGRLDPDGSRRGEILAANPEWENNPAVSELVAVRNAFGVVPVAGSELELAGRMLKRDGEVEARWWGEVTGAIAGLSEDQRRGLALRHIEPVRWAAKNRAAWVGMDRAGLLAELGTKLKGRKGWRATAGDSEWRKKGESLKDWEGQLAWGDVLTILVIDEAMREPVIVSELFAQALKDRADESTEYGGLLWAAENECAKVPSSRAEHGAFRVTLFEPRPTQRANDRTFIAPEAMFAADARAMAHYHFHVQIAANGEYASPGRGDFEFATSHGRSCLVLTSVRQGVMNVDYYQRGEVVIDLGEVRMK